MCSMSVHTASVKVRSWLTTTTTRVFQIADCESVRCSQRTPSMARWFVGSSSISTSGDAKRAEARATRTRHPPESAFMGRARSSSEKPSETSIARARPSAPSASMVVRRSMVSAIFPAAPV
mmetsp:Transcript_60716/g.144458  ORF Transcript_60716/g.144458 Transcript_60716/m.144458 type:complete len:121 (-) Transcript_60716:968-1330(-)